MPARHALSAFAVVLLLLTAGCASLADLGRDPAAFEETGLASFETVETTCGDARSSNTSSYGRPVQGGRRLSINTTIPVRSRETTLDADLDRLAAHRYRLDIERVGGSGVPDCYLETRYNATLNLTDELTDGYTLLVTYDGVLVAGYFADQSSSGSVAGLAPETRYAPWARNVSEANGGLGDGPDDDSDAGGDSGSADGSGGSG